jgi:hypothetical protein
VDPSRLSGGSGTDQLDQAGGGGGACGPSEPAAAEAVLKQGGTSFWEGDTVTFTIPHNTRLTFTKLTQNHNGGLDGFLVYGPVVLIGKITEIRKDCLAYRFTVYDFKHNGESLAGECWISGPDLRYLQNYHDYVTECQLKSLEKLTAEYQLKSLEKLTAEYQPGEQLSLSIPPSANVVFTDHDPVDDRLLTKTLSGPGDFPVVVESVSEDRYRFRFIEPSTVRTNYCCEVLRNSETAKWFRRNAATRYAPEPTHIPAKLFIPADKNGIWIDGSGKPYWTDDPQLSVKLLYRRNSMSYVTLRLDDAIKLTGQNPPPELYAAVPSGWLKVHSTPKPQPDAAAPLGQTTPAPNQSPSATAIFTRKDLLELHESLCRIGRELMVKKNNDYSGSSDDPFGNFRLASMVGVDPVVGIVIRCLDKFSRLMTFINTGNLLVRDEPVQDIFRDVINYMVLAAGMVEETRRKQDAGTDPKTKRVAGDCR